MHKSKFCTEAMMHVPQIVTYVHGHGEMNGQQREALVKPWCKYWNRCGWWKGTSWDEATLIGIDDKEIKPVAIATIIELRLFEGISYSQLVENSVK